ncbi:energy transducer TonB [Pokkaliibacter sp. CJK22405]|uniref:energy transducer TonB n=1 Tax=Pokkaliibacter sp. CJK22405 TaxID=3384615 RepID=UPI003984C4A8
MTTAVPNAPARDSRLMKAVLLALVVHGVVLLGLGFDFPKPARTTQNALDVTLASYDDKQAPEKADYIAQSNQTGSGEQKEKARLTTTERARFTDDKINDLAAQQPESSSQQSPEPVTPTTTPPKETITKEKAVAKEPPKKKVVTTTSKQPKAIKETPKKPTAQPSAKAATHPEGMSLTARSLEIASMEASLDMMRQEYAKRPRKRTLNSNSTQRSEDAFYLNAWKDKIQQVGNMNYPEVSRKEGIYGRLRMMVTLRPDGSVISIKLLESSGHKALDDAAKRIVHLAAPFAPFPPKMRSEVDELEIIRTWTFERDRTLF